MENSQASRRWESNGTYERMQMAEREKSVDVGWNERERQLAGKSVDGKWYRRMEMRTGRQE